MFEFSSISKSVSCFTHVAMENLNIFQCDKKRSQKYKQKRHDTKLPQINHKNLKHLVVFGSALIII